MTKKIIALVLALCFVFAFAACKKDKDNSDTTAAEANTSANGETIANDESSEAESVSGDESTEAQTDASGNTVAPEETKKDTQGSFRQHCCSRDREEHSGQRQPGRHQHCFQALDKGRDRCLLQQGYQ